jgi:hypothetical protein
MQYHIQTLVKHLFDKDSFEQVSVDELKQFTEDYPYVAVGQFLYAKKLKDSGAHNNYSQGEQASLYFHNALWLRWQLDKKEDAPVIPVKAEEQAQQPGFRIVVQMPKNGPAVYTPDEPATGQEEHKEEEPALQEAAAEPVAATPAETIEPAAEAAAPVQEETTPEQRSLQLNENGSLVEQEGREQGSVPAEQTPEAETAQDSPAETETAAPAVAIAENSQLAENSAAEAAQNAVSITEEALTPVAGITENKETDDIVPAVEPIEGEADIDDVVAAVEVSPEMADAKAVPTEIDDIVPAIETVEAEADDIVPAIDAELVPPVEEHKQEEIAEAPAEAEITATAETTPPEIAIEEQVEPIAEPVPAEEPVALVAEAPQQVIAEAAAVPEEPEAEEPAQQVNHFGFTPASKDLKISVDLGEPIFESYHTIDYFASQGIKLGQEDFKDKMGKQLKSFTDWLRSMKRIGPMETNTSLDEVTNKSIQRIADHSVEEKEVLTEAMAEVWAKQGNPKKAIRVYEKLSLLNPAKSTYFATRIEQLKAQ